MKKPDKMLFRMISNSKGQFAAVVTIIVAGIAVFVSLNMSAINMENTVDDYYDSCNFADLYVLAENIPPQKIKDLENIAGIERAEGRISIEVPLITDDASDRVNVKLITSKGTGDEINKCVLLGGRWLKQNSREGMALGQFADARGINPGDKVKVQAGGISYTLEITAIAANPEFVYLMENAQSIMTDPEKFGIIYISEALGKQMSGIAGANEILIKYSGGADEDAIIKSIENQLKNYGFKQTIKLEDQMSKAMVQEEIDQLNRMSGSVPFMFILVAGLVLIMMIGRMIKRDRIKIGILKGLGYNNADIIIHYTKYAAFSGIIGGVLGATIGMACAGGMTKLYLAYFNIPLLRTGFYPSVVAAIIVAACAFCILSGLIGSRGVLKILPADSMKSEAPKPGKRVLLERLPFIWKRFAFSQKLVIKNIFRNKRRAAFVLFGIALTYAMMLFTTSMPGSVDAMMNDHYREFQKMDYIVAFRAPVKQSAINDLRHIVDIKHMEGKLEYAFEFENGNKKQAVSIIGLPYDTIFYTFKNMAGDIVPLPKSGVLLSENLANNLKLKAGDTVKLNSFIPGRNSVFVEIKDVIPQALGANAYMDIGYMGEKLMERNAVNGVYFNSDDEKVYEELAGVSNIASVMSVEETRESFESYMSVMNTAITFLVVFSGILGFCVVYNATTIIIGERETEFSALRVLGLSVNEIFKMILNENNILMASGIAAGIPLGMVFLSSMSSALNTDMYTFKMNATPGAVISAAFFTALFVFFAQFATYQKIKKLDLMAALKNRMN